jgi:hypothetical protein
VAQTERRGEMVVEQMSSGGADKEVEGAPGVGAELGAVSGSSEGDRGGSSRWLNDGSMTAQWWRRGRGGKWAVHGRGCSSYSRWRRERRAARWWW